MSEFRAGAKTAAGYLALPASGVGPGVLVLHAWWGLTEFFTGLCDRLAHEGFVAMAPDIYGNGATATTIEQAEQLIKSGDFEETHPRILATVETLRNHPAVRGDNLGAVGFSMGGAWAL